MVSKDNHYDHVVFVSVDTMRSDAIATHPFPLWPSKYPTVRGVKTGVLDELARGGVFFPNMVSAPPYTAASHGAIFTGQYPLHNGLHEFYNGSLRSPSVFTYGKRAGRRTVMKVDFPIILGPELGFSSAVGRRTARLRMIGVLCTVITTDPSGSPALNWRWLDPGRSFGRPVRKLCIPIAFFWHIYRSPSSSASNSRTRGMTSRPKSSIVDILSSWGTRPRA